MDASSQNTNDNAARGRSGTAKPKEEKQKPWVRPRKCVGKKGAEDVSISFYVKGEPSHPKTLFP